jgi:hypothetical protein
MQNNFNNYFNGGKFLLYLRSNTISTEWVTWYCGDFDMTVKQLCSTLSR